MTAICNDPINEKRNRVTPNELQEKDYERMLAIDEINDFKNNESKE